MRSAFWSVLLVLFICLLSSCGPSDPNEKFMGGANKEIVKNYESNKPQFDKLDKYFKLKHIRYIEITDNGFFNIEYAADSSFGADKYQKLPNQDTGYTTLKNALSLDNLTSGDLLEIKKHLESINTNSMWLINFQDEKTGLKCRGIELRFKENTPFQFFYRQYELPLEGREFVSKETFFYKIGVPHKLGDKTLWYYK